MTTIDVCGCVDTVAEDSNFNDGRNYDGSLAVESYLDNESEYDDNKTKDASIDASTKASMRERESSRSISRLRQSLFRGTERSKEQLSSCCKCNFNIWTSITVALHFIILLTAILCMAPMGVMTSIVRSTMSGIVTYIWLMYSCIMAIANIANYVVCRKMKNDDDESMNSDQDEVAADEETKDEEGQTTSTNNNSETRVTTVNQEGDNDKEVTGSNNTRANKRVSEACNKMGCLCDQSSKLDFCFLPFDAIVTLLLVIEGFLLLIPVFASISMIQILNAGIIEETFASSYNTAAVVPVNPKSEAFNFGQYMLPGSFSYYGGYNNGDMKEKFHYIPGCNPCRKTLQYKVGCSPACEMDIHIPNDAPVYDDGYPVM